MDKLSAKIKLDLTGIPSDSRDDAVKEVADFLLEQILTDASKGVSSVSGKAWAALSPEYKKVKAEESSSPKANLELTGALLDALEYKISGSKIEIGWFDKSQVPKADGHNNFSGDSELPLRQSIPYKGEKFRTGIRDEIANILSEYVDQDEG